MGLSRDASVTLGWGMDDGQPNHRSIFRANGKIALRAEVTEAAVEDCPAFNDDEPPPANSRALPNWAQELRGCDLPNCPVCALARKGYL
jgi:hypothetical protein